MAPLTINGVDQKDIAHFSSFADSWWDLNGPVNSLHPFNDVRVPFVRNGLKKTGRLKGDQNMSGIKILEVGCGVGIYAEGLAKDGAEVTAIDPATKLIEVAEHHKRETMKTHPELKLKYLCELVQDHAEKHEEYYDVIVASEVVEHVPDPDYFLQHCIRCLKPGGSIFITTFNRCFNSIFFGWIWAEWILAMTPRGTHDPRQFMKPKEVEDIFNKYNCHATNLQGFFFEFYRFKYINCENTSIQYGLQGVKNIF